MVTLKPGFRRIQVFLCHDEPKSELARISIRRPMFIELSCGGKKFVVNKKETEYNTFVKLCFVT